MDVFEAAGVAVEVEALLNLRHVAGNRPQRQLRPTGRSGGLTSRRRGRGLEMIDSRTYVEGDDLRHLDRNITARTGELHVRTFHDERERTALLLADFRPCMLWGTRRALRSVAAAEILAAVGWRIIEAGGRVGLVAFGQGDPVFVPPRGRAKGMIRVVGGLAQAHRAALAAASAKEGAADPALQEAIDKADELISSDASVFLATSLDHPGEGFESSIARLARRAPVSVLLMRDAFQDNPPPGLYRYVNGTGPAAMAVVGRRHTAPDPGMAGARLQRWGVDVVPISTARDVSGMLAELDGHERSR